MHYWNYGWGYGMGIGMVLFWGLVVIGVVYLVRYLTRGPSRDEQPEAAPLDILKKRYTGELQLREHPVHPGTEAFGHTRGLKTWNRLERYVKKVKKAS